MPAVIRFLLPLGLCIAVFACNQSVDAGDSVPSLQAVQWYPVSRVSAETSQDDPPLSHPIVSEFHDTTLIDYVDASAHAPLMFDETVVCDTDASCCRDTGSFGDFQGLWVRAEYLYWHTSGMRIPALATTSVAGTARDDAGVLGQPATTVLLGNERLVDDGNSGGRLSVGFWLDDCRDYGIDFIYSGIGQQNDSYAASSAQFPILGRPFFNVDTNLEDARLLGFPNEVSGNLRVDGSTEYQVFELLIRRSLSFDRTIPAYFVYGYRHARLRDSLQIRDASELLSGANAGSTVQSFDSFRTLNTFNGFEAGLLADFRLGGAWKSWQVSVAGKAAFGETDREVTINGQSVSNNAAGGSSHAGGLLTQSTNIGQFESSSHGVLNDFSILLRYCWRPGITSSIGYTIHRWTDLARAGEQIDRSINPTQIPPGVLVGEARPEPLNASSNFIAQGVSVGLEYTW